VATRNSSTDRPGVRSKARTAAQKARRRDLWLAREAERRTDAEARCLARYDELRIEMARHGQLIGSLADALKIDDPAHRFEVIKARVERWDALWSLTLRKRDTRGKIIVGGAVLAELAYNDEASRADRAFGQRLIDLLDRRVLRVRDRKLIRDLLSVALMASPPLPLRRGGPLEETLDMALAAIGEQLIAFDDETEVEAREDLSDNAADLETTRDIRDHEAAGARVAAGPRVAPKGRADDDA
jgi:hypothetical protein